MDLSIIVPVYQVEDFIHACIESIYQQGLDETRFELIIVNDGTKDRSMERIADLLAIHHNITVINHTTNMSLSVARNEGIAQARGEYILMPDSDDLLIENSLPDLLQTALETKADLVLADFLIKTTEEINAMKGFEQPSYETVEKTGNQIFMEYYTPYQSYVWRTLFRRQFLLDNKLTFYPGICFQDVPFTNECYQKAGKCIKTNRVLNIYRVGQESSSKTLNTKKTRDFCISLTETWKLTAMEGLSEETIDRIHDNVFKSFEFLISWTVYSIENLSQGVDVIKFLRKCCPELHFRHGLRQCISSYFFRHTPTAFMAFHYYSRRLKEKIRR